MIDDRRRRDEQRLRRAQEIADSVRERQTELLTELRESVIRTRNEPIVLAAYRRAGANVTWGIPDDVC